MLKIRKKTWELFSEIGSQKAVHKIKSRGHVHGDGTIHAHKGHEKTLVLYFWFDFQIQNKQENKPKAEL